MARVSYEKSVFINCPFDDEYSPILQSICFCIIYLGFNPRLTLEVIDSGQNRLTKIEELIQSSKYSIHDLSKCQAAKKGEYFRLNMPFELGIDHGCRNFGAKKFRDKKFLILEEKKYRYQAAISDLSGCDIEFHKNDYQLAISKTRSWLVNEAGAEQVGPQKIKNDYAYFQEWYFEKHEYAGASEDDILSFPTKELISDMCEWMKLGRPATYN